MRKRKYFPTCLECVFFQLEPGYDGYYPGEHTDMDIGCAKQVWRLDNEDSIVTFDRYMRTAVECEHFEQKEG